MSFGALSANVKEALGRAATAVGTSTTTGDGGMTQEERPSSKTLVYQCLPSRYGFNPDDLRKADAIEIVIGQGAKPGGGGMLLGQKVSDRAWREMRTLPAGIDQRSACRHPDWTGPDDLRDQDRRNCARSPTGRMPIYVKMGATRVGQRREARGACRRRRGRASTACRAAPARDAGRLHRAHRHSDAGRRAAGGGGARGRRA